MGTMGGAAAPVGVAPDSSIQAMKINPQNINEVNASPGNNIMIQKNNIVWKQYFTPYNKWFKKI